jgi:hypothetical protein
MMRDWENKLSGERNAGKFIMTFNERDTPKPEINAFPISDADKQYQFLSEASRTEVLTGHRVTTPLIFGIRAESGFGSNSDEMKIGLQIFNTQVIEPAQRRLAKAFTEVLSYEMEDITINVIPNTPIEMTTTVVTPAPVVAPTPSPAPVTMSKVREIDMSDDDEKYWIEAMTNRGEYIDLNEWQLVSEEDSCHTHEEELDAINKIQAQELASYDSYANGDQKSKWGDAGMYKLRYAYTTNLSKKSREFCKTMVRMAMAGKVFRYEDIQMMSDAGVNGQFAPSGQSTYDIFTFKGGCYCKHAFKRLIFMRKRDEKGRIMPNKGLENEKRVGNVPYVPQKGLEGQTPWSMKNHASLKYT